MAENINDIISRTPHGGTVMLPAGEFEGPVYITKPLRLVGQNTTIWARRGSVIQITCAGAAIESLRAELTEGDINGAVIVTQYPAAVRDVEIVGAVSGFGDEDGFFDVPKTISLGDIPAGEKSSFVLTVSVPCETKIKCGTAGVRFVPDVLPAGKSELEIHVEGISARTILYSEVLFESAFIRRVYLSGRAVSGAPSAEQKRIYSAPQRAEETAFSLPQFCAGDVITIAEEPPVYDLPLLEMKKGQRVGLRQYIGSECEIFFTCEKPAGMDIDPYVFELDANERSFGDKGLVFFGNESGQNGEVVYHPSDGHISLDLNKADYRIQKITLAYSVYAGSPSHCFAQVRNARVAVVSHGKERICFALNGLTTQTTVVALEIYLYKGEWKLSAVGEGYRDGMARLCNHYGIEVEE